MESVIQIRVLDEQKALYEAAAKKQGMKLSAWLRKVADAACAVKVAKEEKPVAPVKEVEVVPEVVEEAPVVPPPPVKNVLRDLGQMNPVMAEFLKKHGKK